MLRAALLSLATCLAILLAGCSPEPAHFNATDVTGADWGRDFHLNDSSGKTRQLTDFRGSAVVLFFGYTQCPDVCPTTMSKLHEVMAQLGEEAKHVQVLFVTLDPERDTPELLAQYVPAFDARFIGLYGSLEATAATAKEFKVFYQKQPGPTPARKSFYQKQKPAGSVAERYTIDHTAGLYIFDPQSRLRLFVRDGEEPPKIVADLKVLLAGK
jgi:protein SCO1/2